MSLFSYQSVCDSVKFYSQTIAPSDATADGVLSISNGPANTPAVPEQTYDLTVVNGASTTNASANHLVLSGQSGGPSPAVVVMDISPSGAVNFPVSLSVAGVPITGGGGGGGGSGGITNPLTADLACANHQITGASNVAATAGAFGSLTVNGVPITGGSSPASASLLSSITVSTGNSDFPLNAGSTGLRSITFTGLIAEHISNGAPDQNGCWVLDFGNYFLACGGNSGSIQFGYATSTNASDGGYGCSIKVGGAILSPGLMYFPVQTMRSEGFTDPTAISLSVINTSNGVVSELSIPNSVLATYYPAGLQ